MPDPTGPDFLAELENFTQPGLTMNPLPASEVRRRGTRMRHRNNALAVVGGVAAVAIIATPIAMAANGGRTDTTPPVTNPPSPTVTWVTEIPAGFPLADGMPEGTQVGPEAAPAGLDVCGTDAGTVISAGDGAAATAGASFEEQASSGTEGRTLTLYADDQAAIAATDGLQQLVAGCATDPNGSGLPLVNAIADGDLGGDASYVVTQQAKDGDLLSDLTTMEVVRTGNAVYVVSSHTSAGGQQVIDSEVQRLADRSAPAIDAMCTFSADPC